MRVFWKQKWIAVLFIIMLIIAGIKIRECIYQSQFSLTCTAYSIRTSKLREPIRILQLTDLHNSSFGDNNRDLIELAAEQEPDLIVITGDLLNSGEERTDVAVSLITDLVKIAPIYVSLGNHEVEYQDNFGTDIVNLYETAGAVVMDKQYQDISVKGQKIRLGGIYGYCLPEKYLETNEADPEECAFLEEFQNTDLYRILLCHMPVCWLTNDGMYEWNVDCVFAGHVHGGQVRIPFIGGLYAPDMGWFPGQLCGIYNTSKDGFGKYKEKTAKWLDDMKKAGKTIPVDAAKYEENGYFEYNPSHLVLSRGLGSDQVIPRFNNIPEIVVVDFVPEE